MNGTRGLVIATAAAFIVGCSVGLMGGILFMRFAGPWPGGPMFGAPRGGPHAMMRRGPGRAEWMMPKLDRALDLTPEQHERIVAHLDRARKQTVAVHESLQVWIERELTPEQAAKWKQMERQFERSRRGRWPRDGRDRP